MGKIIKYLFLLFLLLITQFFIFDKLYLIYLPNVYVFIFFILILPYNFNKYYLLLISFFLGLFMDFSNFTPGLHTIATVFLGYSRQKILEVYSPTIKYENGETLTFRKYGITWFLKYYINMIFIFEFLVFLLQYFSFQRFFNSIFRLFLSTIISFIFILIFYLFFVKRYETNK